MFEKRFLYTCLDWECSKYGKPELTFRKSFYDHMKLKSHESLREIVGHYHLVELPHVLHNYTLVNLITDFSAEPLASKLLQKWTSIK